MMLKRIFAVSLISICAGQAAQAQFVQSRRSVDAGKTSRVYTIFNCQTGIVQGASGTASHGSITTRDAKQNRCGNRTQSVMEVFYTPTSGYKGPDDVYIYWGGGRTTLHFNVK